MSNTAGGKVSILVDPDFTGFPGKLQAGLAGATGAAGNAGRLIGTAIAGGTALAAIGLKKIIDLGIDYQNSLNTLQAVTGATADQMTRVGQTATALGNDLSLPATSAADAAAAMTELAKGGLTVDQAMQAAKGTLQLAAAAQIDGASAAEIQTNALNAFGLSADQAGRVADVLANTANASSGEITDFAAAMQAGSSVASQFGISIEDTSTALGLFANAGIKGSDAGTLLKSALLAVASPSKQAATALDTLGVKAFDAQGKFVGLPVIFEQLNEASKRLTPEQYAAAASIAFGSDAARLAGVAARTSSADWDKMSAAVSKSGGAAELAAAKSKGLGGALEGLKSQAETIGLQVFDKISGPLENFVRTATTGLPGVVDQLGQLGSAAGTKLRPLADGFIAVLDSLRPIGQGIANVVSSGSGLGALGTAATILGGALKIVATVIGPLASVAGGLLDIFSQLPGPIQSVVTTLLLLRAAPAIFSALTGGLRNTSTEAGGAGKAVGLFGGAMRTAMAPVNSVVTGAKNAGSAIKAFGQEMKVQQSLAAASGQEIGKLGAAHAAFATSSNSAVTAVRNFSTTLGQVRAGAQAAGTSITPLQASMRALAETQAGTALGNIAKSFDTAAQGATRFKTTAGLAAGVGKTITSGLGSLVSFLGGPWGVALAGAGLALSILGQKQEEAKAKAEAHKQALENLRSTLDASTGSVTQATKDQIALDRARDGSLTKVTQLGISTKDYVDALAGEPAAIATVNGALTKHVQALISGSDAYTQNQGAIQNLGLSLDTLTQAALGNPAAINAVNDAVRNTAGTSLEAQQRYQGLVQSLMDVAKPAADLAKELGISVEQLKQLTDTQKQAAEASGSFAKSLDLVKPGLAALKDGSEAPQALSTALDGMATNAKKAAQAAGENAAALGGLKAGSDAASKSMQASRDAFIQAGVEAGVDAKIMEDLANKLGLIPKDVATNFTTNAPTATAQVQEVIAKLATVPPSTDVRVNGITEEAKKSLTDLGFTVTAIPGTKDVLVTANTAAATAQAGALTEQINALKGIMQIDANPAGGQAKADELKAHVDAAIGIMTIDGNPQPGTAKGDELKAHIDSIVAILTADANTQPGTDKANQLKATIDSLKGTVTVDATIEAALAKIRQVRAAAAVPVYVPILATGGLGRAAGGIDVKRFANGGIAGMRRMPAGYAQIVRPGTLRVIGDRTRDDEAFIPINRSARSKMLLMLTAQRMGFDLFRRFAEGGIATQANVGLAALRAVRGAGGSGADMRALFAALQSLSQQLATVRKEVSVYAPVYNPIAEKASDTVQRKLRTLSQMGAFE